MSKQEEEKYCFDILMNRIENNSELKNELIDLGLYSTDIEFYRENDRIYLVIELFNNKIEEMQKEIEENRIKIQKLLN